MNYSKRFVFAALLATVAPYCLSACSEKDAGEGIVRVMAYGEEFIEEGIPASDMDDGWAIEFERFDVTIGWVEVGGTKLDESIVVDLSAPSDGGGHLVGEIAVPAGKHTNSSFLIERVEVQGRASRDNITKNFHWFFDQPVKYARCETTTSAVEGEGGVFQITVHADHLFYDSLVSANPQLLFSPLADADTNEDGEITSLELEATDIGAYDPGNEGASDLWSFLNALNSTIGHVDGEGHCDATAVDG